MFAPANLNRSVTLFLKEVDATPSIPALFSMRFLRHPALLSVTTAFLTNTLNIAFALPFFVRALRGFHDPWMCRLPLGNFESMACPAQMGIAGRATIVSRDNIELSQRLAL